MQLLELFFNKLIIYKAHANIQEQNIYTTLLQKYMASLHYLFSAFPADFISVALGIKAFVFAICVHSIRK